MTQQHTQHIGDVRQEESWSSTAVWPPLSRRCSNAVNTGFVPKTHLHALAMLHWQVRDLGNALLNVAEYRVLACSELGSSAMPQVAVETHNHDSMFGRVSHV